MTAFVDDAVRTPFRRHGGALAGVRPGDLDTRTLRALLDRFPQLDPARIGDVVLGDANSAGEDDDVGAVELDGTFGVQSLACVDAWKIDPDLVDTRGGALASGHPLGAPGGRVLPTPGQQRRERRERWGAAAIGIGVGQGLSVVLKCSTS